MYHVILNNCGFAFSARPGRPSKRSAVPMFMSKEGLVLHSSMPDLTRVLEPQQLHSKLPRMDPFLLAPPSPMAVDRPRLDAASLLSMPPEDLIKLMQLSCKSISNYSICFHCRAYKSLPHASPRLAQIIPESYQQALGRLGSAVWWLFNSYISLKISFDCCLLSIHET